MTDLATQWHDALRKARTLHPDRVAAAINATADSGLRAQRFDAQGGRTTFRACECPEQCDEGPTEHSHMVTSDPTGNAAVNRRPSTDNEDLYRLNRAHIDFVSAANVVLDWVSGETAGNWQAVVSLNARIMPGSIQAGLDVDDERALPYNISKVSDAVSTVARIARFHTARTPSQDEQHWTAGMADEDCCSWHLSIHRRYRRPRVTGTNICADCVSLATLLGQKPPTSLLEAEVDRETKPKAWTVALGRCMDELGVRRSA